MAGSINITRTALTPGGGGGPDGSYVYGPVQVADTDTSGTITIDRTVNGGFNATPAATADLTLDMSLDGGATWRMLASAHIVGGRLTNDDPKVPAGTIFTVSAINVSYYDGTARQVRAQVAVQGAPVTITGSVSTQ